MHDSQPNVTPIEEPISKAPGWSRSTRTSCDACKQMKIKCRRKDDESCTRCIAKRLCCTTTPVERKKRKLTNKKAAFDEMEDRIKRMESAILTTQLHVVTEPEDEKSDKIENQAWLSNHLENLVIEAKGCPNFIGWASGFSLLSPQGLQWMSQTLSDKEDLAQLAQMFQRDFGAWGSGEAELWHPTPRSRHSPLPPKDLALQYVDCFFSAFNNGFPILNQKVFSDHLDRQYSSNPPAGTAWYALLNAVLCLGSIRSKSHRKKNPKSTCLVDYTSLTLETGVEYFRNASSCFHELFFKEANLMAMQAMTLMLFITTSSPNPQPSYIMTSAVGNLANTLGLHRRSDGLDLAPEDIEQRRNVYWVFYIIEKSTSHSLGRPSFINDDDVAVDLPPQKPVTIQKNGTKTYDFFQDQIKLAIIGSRIYTELYSASSLTKSEADRMKVLGKLDDHLQRWQDALPIEIRPEHPILCSEEQYASVIMMHFTYLEAVIQLHRLSGHHKSFQDDEAPDMKREDLQRLNPRVHASYLLCLAAARRSIRLLDTFSNNTLQNQHFMWRALYYPMSASLILFANIFANPEYSTAPDDIRLMNSITTFISQSVQPGTSFAATPTVSMFQELYSIATRLVARVPPQARKQMKRPAEVEDVTETNIFSSLPDSSDISLPHSTVPSFENEIPTSISYSHEYVDQNIPQENQYIQYNASPYDIFEDSPLEFAPFLLSDPSQFDYDPTIDDPLFSSTNFDWVP